MANAKTNGLIDVSVLSQAAHCLRTLAHPHRLRIVQMLLNGQYTVGELAEACGIPSHMASEHICLMKDRGLLTSRREGRCAFYEIAEPGLEGIMSCIKTRFERELKRSVDS